MGCTAASKRAISPPPRGANPGPASLNIPEPFKPGYEIAIPEKPEGGAAPAAAPQEPLSELLAHADPKRGEQIAKVCQTCHTFDKGGPI